VLAGERIVASKIADVTEPNTFQEIVTFDETTTMEDTLTISPTAGAGAQHIVFNEGYSIYADNTGAGTANNRLWIDTPDNGQVVIGPRAGASLLEDLRLRTDATVASAANMFIDSSTYKISRSTSSLNYKQDVEDLTLDLAAMRALRPVRFHDKGEMRSDPANARWYVGLIAEEVHALGLTGFVSYMNGEPDAVMYDRICLGLLQLNAAAEQRIDALEATVALLVEQINGAQPG
jgi:hypothetical protein